MPWVLSVFFHTLLPPSLHQSKKVPQGPLVIPALKNRDWRELARKRRTVSQFVPESGKAATGKDGSVGGLGVRDTINNGPVLSGLQIRAKVNKEEDSELEERPEAQMEGVEETEETEDQKALRAILADAEGKGSTDYTIDVIPTPVSEADAYKQDVDELPDVATLEDYNRVPVEQFGLALLRGMGWKEGTAASRKPGKGLVEPYLPEARPALLGIGAKEREVFDDGSNKKGNANKRPERRYVPVIKQDKDGRSSSRDDRDRSPRRTDGSTTTSRRNSRSRSPGRRRDYDDNRRDSNRRESSYDDREWDSSRRDSGYDSRHKESSRRDYDRRDYDRRDDSDRYSSRRRD